MTFSCMTTTQITSSHDMQMALQPHEVETSLPPLQTLRMTLPLHYCYESLVMHNLVYGFQLMKFYFPYMEASWRLIWILMVPDRQHKFHVLLLISDMIYSSFQIHLVYCAIL